MNNKDTQKSTMQKPTEGHGVKTILGTDGREVGFVIEWNDGSNDVISARDLPNVHSFFALSRQQLNKAGDQ